MVKMPHWPVFVGSECTPGESLIRIKNILPLLGNPQNKLKNVIHITGTKGKGSTALFIAQIAKESGYNVNIYTSPHIYECNERIKLNGKNILDEYLQELIEKIRFVVERNNLPQPSLMETMTCCAMIAFSQNNADVNVIEVGMGGLLDTTNVFQDNPPLCAVFTPIHLDHKLFLGDTIESITFHKSFIAPIGTKNVVLSSQSSVAKNELLTILHSRKITNILSYQDDYEVFENEDNQDELIFSSQKLECEFTFSKPSMEGKHQYINASCAVATILTCIDSFSNILQDSISKGVYNTHNLVRMEKVKCKKYQQILPLGSVFYMDGAHNQLAASMLFEFISSFTRKNIGFKVCLIVARSKNVDNKAFFVPFIKENGKSSILDLVVCTRANLESIPEPPEKISQACEDLKIKNRIAYNI
ncbi:MAG: hypothetical protein RL208_725, partial [Pseudomonadota bacterium]